MNCIARFERFDPARRRHLFITCEFSTPDYDDGAALNNCYSLAQQFDTNFCSLFVDVAHEYEET